MEISAARSSPPSLGRALPLEGRSTPPPADAPADRFTRSAATVSRPPVAGTAASAPATPSPFQALLADGFPEAFRAPVTQALAALPPEVPDALAAAGYRLQVVSCGPDAPLPFHFEPYPVDRLREAAPSIAAMSPRDHKSVTCLGARVVSERSDPYMTFDDLARQRGASTREEVAEMADLAALLNPGVADPAGNLPPGRPIFIPDYYCWKGQRVPTAAWNALTQEEQGIAGTTFDKGIPGTDAPRKFILMSASAFADTPDLVRFYLHHEMGHAVVDVLTSRDPAFAKFLMGEMGERMEADRKAKILLRPYSGSEPDEFIADAFAARFLAAPSAQKTPEEKRQASLCGDTLHERDARAFDLAGQMVDHLGSARA